jgi:DNA-directed RNA polymerase specialized sigma24 family protein
VNELPDEAAETEALLRAVRAGQTLAMEQLFAQHRDYLRGMLELRMDVHLRSRVDVSDVIQETHLEALRRIGISSIDGRCPFGCGCAKRLMSAC